MRYWVLFLSAFCIIGISCNETIPVGSDLLPSSDNPNYFFTDTTTLFSFTVTEDSLRSDKVFLSQLGYIEDPIFGSTKSSQLIGFLAPTRSVSTSLIDTVGGYVLDSIYLNLILNNIYGDSTLPMNFTVYKLSSSIDNSNIYYSNLEFEQGMIEIGRIENFAPKLSDDYDEDTTYTNLGPQMRIRLNPFFGQSLINILNTNIISSSDLFHQFFPGLIIVPDEVPGSMIELDLLVSSSTSNRRTALEDCRIQMYYKNSLDTSLNVIFPATVINLGVGKYEHNFASSNVETALELSNPEGDEVNYVQGLAGVKTKVEFPHLEASYGSGNVAVNKAEIVITQLLDGFEDTYLPPERILAVHIGDNGENVNISDFNLFTSAHTDGFGQEVTLDNGDVALQYRINISDYFQRLIFGQEENNGIYLTLYGAQNTSITSLNSSDLLPDRIVIGGGNNGSEHYKLKLDLSYTVLD